MNIKGHQTKVRSNFIGWFIASCFVSVACLPQTSGVLGVNQNDVQVGLTIDANSRLQNMIVASAENTVVRLCQPQTSAEQCFSGQGTIPLAAKGTIDGINIHAIEDAATLASLAQFESMELYVGTPIDGNINPNTMKSFIVEVEATNPNNIAATPVAIQASSTPATPQTNNVPQGALPATATAPVQGEIPESLSNSRLSNGQIAVPVVDMSNAASGTPRIIGMTSVAETQFNQSYDLTINDPNLTCRQQNGVLVFTGENRVGCIPR